MRLWGGESDSGCCSVSDVDDARRVRRPPRHRLTTCSTSARFRAPSSSPTCGAPEGRTPNPCIECNRHLKFDRLLRRADHLGFDAVATGHHAQIADGAGTRRGRPGRRPDKDQSYVLHMLDQATLARTLFPIGGLDEGRRRAGPPASACAPRTSPTARTCASSPRPRGGPFLGQRTALTPGWSRRRLDVGVGAGGRARHGRPAQGPRPPRWRPDPARRSGRCRRRDRHRGLRRRLLVDQRGRRPGELGRRPRPRRAARPVRAHGAGRAGVVGPTGRDGDGRGGGPSGGGSLPGRRWCSTTATSDRRRRRGRRRTSAR